MSRRKQGRPQQRKALDSLEQENDLLLCGECQTSFPLQDILKFIRHKVNKCSKKIVDVLDSPEYEDGPHSDSEHCGSITSKRTSISAPISLKEAIENNKSPRSSLDSLGSLKDVRIKEENGHSPMEEDKLFEQKLSRSPLKPRKVVDAESNTTNTEPSKFVCDSCRSTFGSAWSLLQHAQKEHGMRIYTTSLDKQQKYPEQPHKKERDERNQRDHIQHDHSREHRDHREHRHHDKHNSSPSNHRSQQTSHLPQQQQAPQHQPKQRDEQRDTPLLCQSHDPHRTPPSASSVGSADSGSHLLQDGGHHLLPPHPSPHSSPFLFKFPFDRPPPLSPGLPFCRPPNLGLDFPIDPSLQRSFVGFPPMFDGGPSPPFPNLFERPRQSPVGIDNQLESYYSQRLRQLASSTSGSPSPVRKQTPPFSQPGPSPTTFPPVTPPSSLSSDMEKPQHGSGSITPPAKLKSCEFCGKSFRFQSNLIVHRRSHTGEKPFKCPLCPHACTQQSKLKRHMKTHMNKSPLSMSNASNMSNDGSLASGSSTPDSSKRFMDDEDDEEEEEEEENEEEMEEEEEIGLGMEEEAYKNGFKDNFKDGFKDGFNPPKKLEINSSPKSSELAARLLEPACSPGHQEHPKEPERASPYTDKTSLLSEVMKNTGLTNFPAYNEAFKQAMAERVTSPVGGQEEQTSENCSNNSSNSSQDDMKEDSLKKSSSDSDSEAPCCKRIKNEPIDPSSFPTNNMENHHIYSLWGSMGFPAPPPQDFYHLSLPGMQFDCAGPNHNGYSPSTPESAMKSFNAQTPPKAGPSTPVSGDAAHMRKDRTRNDTCEFCGKIFKNCSNLTVHRRSHTGEKPYKCILCNYACAQSSKLTRHMKTHGRIGKDVYKCKFCLMPFSVPSTLEKHMRKCVENRTPGLIRETDSDSTSSNATTPTLNCQPGILQESSMDRSSANVPLNCAPGILQDTSLDKNSSSTPNL
ncbi:B-cell lymphoma/leukemia 11A-like [Mizuhopecten yessoensis]|uniref:B-cell lymphoma/leukemia 11A n=1 Tax=Mizuhopecten yessoensis TaxID=6573 RepID=A0A210R2H4_MIZYE|nr:B-cell lymphoma/leukemia 11A-like [Mizuhopecten yessoensis]OWF55105.1 B-cell lymphoma/leukemia 11A [Mizuhopecten yessoensis]